MKNYLLFIFCAFFSISGISQNETSPYETHFWKDGAWITAGIGLNVVGFSLIQNKDYLTEEEVNALDKNEIWKIDRWAAGYSSKKDDELSYIPFYGSFALPLAFLAGENERGNFGQIALMYVETMATTGALFTITAGAIQKARPLVYDESLPMEDRRDKDAQRSFYAGHTAATAAATFFAAKVFHDFNPDSRALPYVWAGAAAIPAFVGYLRTTSGKHFLTDNLIGFGLGAAAGILIPEIHKKKNKQLDVYPTANFNVNGSGISTKGLALSYSF